LGRGDAGEGAGGVLLRVYTHAFARRHSVTEIRRQAHHGSGHTVHGPVHAVDAVRGVLGLHAADRAAVRRRTRRSELGITFHVPFDVTFTIRHTTRFMYFPLGYDVPGALHASGPVGAFGRKGKTLHAGVRG